MNVRFRTAAAGVLLDAIYGRAPAKHGAYAGRVKSEDEGSATVRAIIASGDPCLVARFGSTELAVASFYTRWRRERRLPIPYPQSLRRIIKVNSGFFPATDAHLDRFCEVLLAAASSADVMAVWFNRSEDRIVERWCPNAELVILGVLDCVIRSNPWSSELEGKKVLVVHPFAQTIESQYRNRRTLLFENPAVLPEFELKTIAAVQSVGHATCPFPTWFDALDHMRRQIEATDFDIAIIGAGAYGLPLGAAVKSLGRQAIHMGGTTQLLFGIRGRRWEEESPDDIALLFNEHWVRPSREETPVGSDSVEGGCYW